MTPLAISNAASIEIWNHLRGQLSHIEEEEDVVYIVYSKYAVMHQHDVNRVNAVCRIHNIKYEVIIRAKCLAFCIHKH